VTHKFLVFITSKNQLFIRIKKEILTWGCNSPFQAMSQKGYLQLYVQTCHIGQNTSLALR